MTVSGNTSNTLISSIRGKNSAFLGRQVYVKRLLNSARMDTRSVVAIARLRSFISSVILPSSLSYVPCTVLKFRALDRFPGINVPGIFYSRNFLNWVLTALFHPLANV